VKYLYNAIKIVSTNKYLDFTDDAGTFAAVVPEKIYNTPVDLAAALQDSLNSVSTEDYTVVYNNETGRFTIASATTSDLDLLWNTGTNAANSIGTTIGFLVAADDTGSLTYTSDNAQSYVAPYTPSYDAGEKIVVKGAELFVGSQDANVCICAQTVEITIGKEVEDVDCICEETGVKEKIPTARSASMQITALLKQHDASLLDATLKNTGISAMLNLGPKLGGNWVAGQCFNAYLRNCTVSGVKNVGDNYIQAEFTLTGYVTNSSKDIYLNFL